MTPEERSDLASLHALSLLDGDEAAMAARLEATDPAFAAEVAAFSEGIAVMAEAIGPVQPSEVLRARLMAAVKPIPAIPKPRPSWAGWAAAAVMAVSAVWLWTSRESLLNENDEIRAQLSGLKGESTLAGLRIASLEGQLDQYKGTRAVVVWDPTNSQGQIELANLPQLDAEKDYQLWIVDPAQKNPVSAGLIHRAADGSAKVPFQPVQLIKDAAAFAISVEKKGGVDVGEGPIVILGK